MKVKVQHPAYANQKLATEWGTYQCDESGSVEIHPNAKDFFVGVMKFKPHGKKGKETSPEIPSFNPLTDASSDDAQGSEDEEESEDEGDKDMDAVVPVNKERQSRFTKRVKDIDHD